MRILLKIRYLAQKRIMVGIFDFARFSLLSQIWTQMQIFFSEVRPKLKSAYFEFSSKTRRYAECRVLTPPPPDSPF